MEWVVECGKEAEYLSFFEEGVLSGDELVACLDCVQPMQIRSYYLLCELQLHLVLDRHAFEFHTALLL